VPYYDDVDGWEPDGDDFEAEAEYSDEEIDAAGAQYLARLEDDEKDRRNIERFNRRVRSTDHLRRQVARGRGNAITVPTVVLISSRVRGRASRGRRVEVGNRTSRSSPRRSDDSDLALAGGSR
jgi:hypothetical protein